MLRIWTVARQTLTQCLRSRIQLIFIALLVAFLALLPEVMSGDNTLAGRIRSFLDYSLGITGFLLGTITILMSVHLVSTDVTRKYVLSVATKPLARWQYVIGRWLGVVLLNGLLLLLASAAVYAQVQLMRGGKEADAADRLEVEAEIFSARRQVQPEPIGMEQQIQQRLDELRRDQAGFERMLNEIMLKTGIDREQALREIYTQVAEEVSDRMEVAEAMRQLPGGSVMPSKPLEWAFQEVSPPESVASQEGSIADKATFSVPTASGGRGEMVRYRVEVGKSILGLLMQDGPVSLAGIEARVIRMGAEWFDAILPQNQVLSTDLGAKQVGDEIDVSVHPTINLVFKLTRVGGASADAVSGIWQVRSPSGREVYNLPRQFPLNQEVRIPFPARIAREESKVVVRFHNYSATRLKIPSSDVSIWYPVAGFLDNFTRSVYLRWVQLMFLAAVGVFFGTFLSFPVGIIASFCLLPFGLMRGFLSQAAEAGAREAEAIGLFSRVALAVQQAMFAILPNLQATSTQEYLVDGLVIPFSLLGSATFYDVLVRCVLLIGAGCLIWHRRELSKPQEG